MRIINLEELKNIQLQILDTVHRYCLENNITYFLSSGTLIGAVRHKGYIPWDDDIDIYMLRPDYERFVSSFNQNNDLYRVVSLRTNKDCTFAYAKVERTDTKIVETVDNPMEIGVNIDVFPIDGVPDDLKKRKEYFSKLQRQRNNMLLKDISIDFLHRGFLKNLILSVGKLLLSFRTLPQLAAGLDNAINKDDNNTKYVCNVILGNGFGSEFSRDAIRDSLDIEFEGNFYKTMIGYDEYLTKTYGDYMQLPPVEKRVSTHTFKAWWK